MKCGVWKHHEFPISGLTNAPLVTEQNGRGFALGVLKMLIETRARGLDAFKTRLRAPSSDRSREGELPDVGASVDHNVSDPDGGS